MAEFITLQGKTRWFRHVKPEEFKGKSHWKHVLYPDKESLEKIRDLQAQGLKNVLKKDEDGYHINFSRPTKIEWKDRKTGEEKFTVLEPPQVILADGRTKAPELIGNGSDVTTKLEIYEHAIPNSTKKAKAARWLATRIDNLVPYDKTGNPLDGAQYFSAEEQRAVKGLDAVPPQPAGWP